MIKILPKLRSRRKSSEAKYRVVMCHEFAHSTDRYDVDVFFNLNDEVQITSVRPITMEKWKALNRHSNVSTQPSDGSQPLEPPKVAEFLAILCAKTIGDALIGCLNEQYAREYVEYGPERARRRYWAEAARSFGPLLWRALCRAVKAAAVIDAFRRYFSG